MGVGDGVTPYIWKWWDTEGSGPHDQWAREGLPDDDDDEEKESEDDIDWDFIRDLQEDR